MRDFATKVRMFFMAELLYTIAKVCSVHCSTGRLALGSPGCSFGFQFQFQFHNFYFQSIEITFENSGQTQKTEFSVAEEFAIIIM